MPTLVILFLFAILNCCQGLQLPARAKPDSQPSAFPELGFEACDLLAHDATRQACSDCFDDAGSDTSLILDCISDWLPGNLASCATKGKALQGCLRKAMKRQMNQIKRANVLYKKGGKYLKRVGDSNIIQDGPAAIFSCMAQELIMNQKEIQPTLEKECASCFDRFETDPENAKWHLGKGNGPKDSRKKNIVPKGVPMAVPGFRVDTNARGILNLPKERGHNIYEAGAVGHDMPFMGVGPFAVDYLKGECIFSSLADAEDLDSFVESIIKSSYPVPAWIFREILNHITSITLP